MKTNKQFKNEALDALHGNWGKAVLATVVYLLIAFLASGPATYGSSQMSAYIQENAGTHASLSSMAAMMQDPAYQLLSKRSQGTSALTTLITLLVLFPFTVGFSNALRHLLVYGEKGITANAFRIGFTENYWRKVWTMLWMTILISLWSLLLLIPGFIKGFSYAMTPFILEDNPELGAVEAIHRSRMMMRGHKFDLFWLYLSFIGWFLLSILTLGIGFLWLVPYMETAQAAFYEEVKADYALNGGLD